MNRFNSSILSITILFSIAFLSLQPAFANQPISESGSVTETMDASGYTYINVNTGNEKIWVAVPASEIQVGDRVTFLEGMEMKDFYSKTLDRTFDSIIFSSGLLQANAKAPQAEIKRAEPTVSSFADAVKQESGQPVKQQQQPSSAGSAGATVPFLEAKVDKAAGENGITVEEAFKQAARLDGSKVRIRGKVVKFSPNIMGRNWIHIQDGTGNPMENTHDLVITTAVNVQVDDIILVEGKITANKDFGYGYKYDALIEEASLVK